MGDWPTSELEWAIYWRALFWACAERQEVNRKWRGERNLSEAVALEFAEFTSAPSKLTLIFDSIERSVFDSEAGIVRAKKRFGLGPCAPDLWKHDARCTNCSARFHRKKKRQPLCEPCSKLMRARKSVTTPGAFALALFGQPSAEMIAAFLKAAGDGHSAHSSDTDPDGPEVREVDRAASGN